MGHPNLERVKAETEREARIHPRKSNDAPKDPPKKAHKPALIKGNPPAHGEGEEDAGHEMITGHR